MGTTTKVRERAPTGWVRLGQGVRETKAFLFSTDRTNEPVVPEIRVMGFASRLAEEPYARDYN